LELPELREGRLSRDASEELQRALGLSAVPNHIECFDISHFQGRQTVASMSCFQDGKPHKDHYRKFRIRSVSGIDDFACMAEVVRRRYGRLAKKGGAFPDLILIDGGKGQLSAAIAALREIKAEIPMASLAKRIEEIFVPDRADSILLPRGSPAQNLVVRLRDEAHRFAVNYHRLLRGKKLGV
jgi:excinuclease ABC subunit C